LNPACVAQAVRTAMALKGHVNRHSTFDRKHYFYYDLPHGYQITQKDVPIMSNGVLAVNVDGNIHSVRIKHLQLEMVLYALSMSM